MNGAAERTETIAVEPAATTGPVVRRRSVRRTVDLAPTTHRGLDNWQSDAADRLGLARITGQEVLAALVHQLLTDDDLAEKIFNVIASQH